MPQMYRVGRGHTKKLTDGDDTVIRLYNTDIVRFGPSGVTLSSGGWQTNTTKTRMNQTSNQHGLGFYVYQEKHKWYVVYREETYEFYDGMKLGEASDHD